jgi:ABC-type nitrate/sulfonate/bicarbonate transport system substrate-binding protein
MNFVVQLERSGGFAPRARLSFEKPGLGGLFSAAVVLASPPTYALRPAPFPKTSTRFCKCSFAGLMSAGQAKRFRGWIDAIGVAVLVVAVWLALRGVGATSVCAAGLPETTALPATHIRIGIDPETWQGLNHNDANAAIIAWMKTILQQRRLAMEVETRLFGSAEEVEQALRSGQVDAVSMLTSHFLSLDPGLRPNQVFIPARNHSIYERYVLLTRRNSGIENASGLRGRPLVMQSNTRSGLAAAWLDTLLSRQSPESADVVMQAVSKVERPSKAVLMVFFGQADACVVTTNVFELAAELNPQLHENLHVIAISPEVVPAVFFFRPDYVVPERTEMEKAIVGLHETEAGLQSLTLFQCDAMTAQSLSCLESTRQLLADCRSGRPALPAATKPGAAFPSRNDESP